MNWSTSVSAAVLSTSRRTLLRRAALAMIAISMLGASATADTVALTPDQVATLKAVHLWYANTIGERSRAFPEVVFVSCLDADAPAFFVGGFVGSRWFGGDTVCDPIRYRFPRGVIERMAQSALAGRNWRRASPAQRRALALRWVESEPFPNESVEPGSGAHRDRAPRATANGRDITVTAWVDQVSESFAGPQVAPARVPTRFVFHADGSLRVEN